MLSVEKDGFTRVERGVAVESGVGMVPVDVSLAELAEVRVIGFDGGELVAKRPLTLACPLRDTIK